MKVTVLGCGPSSGVPLVTGNWGDCNPDNPKNSRSRPSILVEQDEFRLLIDTSPDLRMQLLRNSVKSVDAVLYTHEHADHVMGIDDLRGMWRQRGQLIDVFGPADVLQALKNRFGYLFKDVQDPFDLYKAIFDPHDLEGPFSIGPFESIVPVEQDHGICTSWGYRFVKFAYSTDVVAFDEAAFEALAGIDTWIVDCLRDGEKHPTHANLATTLSWVRRLGVRHTILTHMNFQSDYDAMCAACPDGVEPAYDGMVIEVDQ
jgi:phosphoribosyl 1,2-cyclic phosphate phosphodiesterase